MFRVSFPTCSWENSVFHQPWQRGSVTVQQEEGLQGYRWCVFAFFPPSKNIFLYIFIQALNFLSDPQTWIMLLSTVKVLGLLLLWMRACKVQETWTLIHSTRLQCDTVEPFHDVLRPWSGWSDLSGPGPTCKQELWKLSTWELPLNGLPSLLAALHLYSLQHAHRQICWTMLACDEVVAADKGGSNRMMAWRELLKRDFLGFVWLAAWANRPGSEFSWSGFLIVSLMGANQPFLPFTSGR